MRARNSVRQLVAAALLVALTAEAHTVLAADASTAFIRIGGRVPSNGDGTVTLTFTEEDFQLPAVSVQIPPRSTEFSSAVLILDALRSSRRFQKTAAAGEDPKVPPRAELLVDLLGAATLQIRRNPLTAGSDFTLRIASTVGGQTFHVQQQRPVPLPADRDCPSLPLTVAEGRCEFDLDGKPGINPKSDLVLEDKNGNGFCELTDTNRTAAETTLRFTKCTPTEFVGQSVLTTGTVAFDPGAALWADPDPPDLRPLTSLHLIARDSVAGLGDLALTARKLVYLRADRGVVALSGFVRLDATGVTLKAHTGVLVLPLVVDPRGFTARGRSYLHLFAKTPIGMIFVAGAKLGARDMTIDNIPSATKVRGFVRIDDSFLTTRAADVKFTSTPGYFFLKATRGRNEQETAMALTVSNFARLAAGGSLYVDTKDVGDHVCFSDRGPTPQSPRRFVFVDADDIVNFNGVEGFIYREGNVVLPPLEHVRGEDRFNSPFDDPAAAETCPRR